jgi:hypothetical protein
MEADVAVAEQEPRLAAQARHRVERVPRLVGAPPAALLVREPGQRVEDRVDVRADVQAEDLLVVRYVRYDGNIV